MARVPAPASQYAGRAEAVLAAVLSAQITFAIVLRGIPGLLPAVREEFGVSVAEVGFVVFAPGIGMLLTMLAWGTYADRHGERWGLPVGVLGVAIGVALAALADDFWIMIGALVLAGAAGGVSTTTSRAAAAWFPVERRARAVSLVITGLAIGGAIGAVGLAALGETGGVTLALGVTAVACAGSAIALAVILRTAPDAEAQRAARSTRYVPKGLLLWAVIVATALVTFASLATMGYVPLYLHEERGFGTIVAGFVLGASMLATAAFRTAIAPVADRTGNRLWPATAICALGVALLVVFAVSLDGPDWLVVAAAILAPAVMFSSNGLSATVVAEMVPAHAKGRALAVRNSVVYGAGALAPLAFGALASGVGYGAGILMAAVVGAAGTGLFIAALRPHSARETPPA